jgi:hypothetical protein
MTAAWEFHAPGLLNVFVDIQWVPASCAVLQSIRAVQERRQNHDEERGNHHTARSLRPCRLD